MLANPAHPCCTCVEAHSSSPISAMENAPVSTTTSFLSTTIASCSSNYCPGPQDPAPSHPTSFPPLALHLPPNPRHHTHLLNSPHATKSLFTSRPSSVSRLLSTSRWSMLASARTGSDPRPFPSSPMRMSQIGGTPSAATTMTRLT